MTDRRFWALFLIAMGLMFLSVSFQIALELTESRIADFIKSLLSHTSALCFGILIEGNKGTKVPNDDRDA